MPRSPLQSDISKNRSEIAVKTILRDTRAGLSRIVDCAGDAGTTLSILSVIRRARSFENERNLEKAHYRDSKVVRGQFQACFSTFTLTLHPLFRPLHLSSFFLQRHSFLNKVTSSAISKARNFRDGNVKTRRFFFPSIPLGYFVNRLWYFVAAHAVTAR